MTKSRAIDFEKNWVFLTSRPFSLFGASLYQAWFDPPRILDLYGASIANNIYVEGHPGVIRRYVIKEEQGVFEQAIKKVVANKEKSGKILQKAEELNKQADTYVAEHSSLDLSSAVNFLIELALHATVFTYFSYPILKEEEESDLLNIAESLRGVSYYPLVMKKVVAPLALKEVGKLFEIMTIAEVLAHDKSNVVERRELVDKGQRFILAKVDGEEQVEYMANTTDIIEKLEKVDIKKEVKGQVAYPGKVTGKVRIVLTSDPNVEFDEGDILLVVSSQPTLMPLILKCGAMVSDEGGVACHAAIVSRELKKPCVIGTQFATYRFKDGDVVEVDADNGVVRIINKK